ncbi:hypothetical protein C4566_00650 [Candidatus Parcubacteria bacterium]|nr:MAG: hypothetical protein C4566_00650 [Candidatus Parcubacteria bacterium]
MFKAYSVKVKVIFIVVIVLAIVLLIVFNNYNKGKARDLQMVIQAKSLAISLEEYYDKFNAYPATASVSLDSIYTVTQAGLNQNEGVIYFKRDFEWARPGKYLSDGRNYAIDFDLDYGWSVWGLDRDGGKCRVSTNVTMACIADN